MPSVQIWWSICVLDFMFCAKFYSLDIMSAFAQYKFLFTLELCKPFLCFFSTIRNFIRLSSVCLDCVSWLLRKVLVKINSQFIGHSWMTKNESSTLNSLFCQSCVRIFVITKFSLLPFSVLILVNQNVCSIVFKSSWSQYCFHNFKTH